MTEVKDKLITVENLKNAYDDNKKAIDELKGDLGELNGMPISYDLTWISGEYLDDSGNSSVLSSWDRTDYIEISSDAFSLIAKSDSYYTGDRNFFYDNDHNVVGRFEIGASFIIPYNAKFFRISKPKTQNISCVVNNVYSSKDFAMTTTKPLKACFTDGYYIDDNGAYATLDSWKSTFYLPISSLITGLKCVSSDYTGDRNFFYDEDKNVISRFEFGDDLTIPINAKYFALSIPKSYTNISILLTYVSFDYLKNANNFRYNINGKHCHVYRFGGLGNDWCFVRTPSNYDKDRKKPYPFVICNHGNGWVMDGTEQFANWTKRTMYVPLTDSDYIANPTQYNGTDDSSLWYSNPTIETLLNAGYIVCGCENYGDGLYGNANCRNACVDFYNHIVKNYNVTDYCYMIGASNGAQTSINASYLLGSKVKAMVLQYPLTCLVNQYFGHPDHQSGIRSAYGITNASIDRDGLINATKTHDVLNTDVISGVKVGYFPPTKLYYSTTDSVVNYQQNSLALQTLLGDSLKWCSTQRVDSDGEVREHGDYAHFNPNEYLAWFERW